MLALVTASACAFSAPIAQRAASPRAAVRMESKADLEKLAKELNPALGFFDPLNLAEQEFWGQSNEATIGFLRHSEIKHGRVAMAGFCGWIAHANGLRFPWAPVGGEAIASGLSPPDLWDAIPLEAKAQIILGIGVLEFWSECAGTHYMRGGKPGAFPSFTKGDVVVPHPVPLDLYDPFNLSAKKSEEAKAKGLVKEINNGRLAMLGLFGFLCEAKIPGSVPLLSGIVSGYSGEPMAPFGVDFPGLSF
mmetsp:Transcript_22273/g.57216  ORF Transcript_22273/g.57216 Transcript_22273/m.57216 type:complete len:248 (+) Transcript_22273:49-792(+)|eukprot:CAMPEP_0119406720 /NCGR_PEP_ID=MMETSP1335-20130426/935_1 /TAXON_ID=259385 /ORGANISM="Chrysoculter rhomboideus, Strain RCC1486" /LENGTH=247 /DNA_ID=CAMNT_0007430811 /DNA_START=26 /DNA_END=769 /DNA_ORIENTATION=+